MKLLLLLKDNPSLYEVGVGAPLRPNVSKGSISATPLGGEESFLILLGLLKRLIRTFIELFMNF